MQTVISNILQLNTIFCNPKRLLQKYFFNRRLGLQNIELSCNILLIIAWIAKLFNLQLVAK